MDEKWVTQLKVCCIVAKTSKVLLIKEWSDSKKDYLWNIVKGTFEGDIDKNLVSCVKREIVEETNLRAFPTEFLGIVNKNGFSTRVYFGFLCKLSKTIDLDKKLYKKYIAGEDITEVKWFSLPEIRKLKEDQFVNDVGYYFVQKWLSGETYPMETLKEIYLNSKSTS
ncbi:MAG: hypothetical protein UT89_C0010G0002 [Parcubacteria group bacterium GW2011_GWE1_40_20]|nr:MAG: hypothetical protein UT89_C0010G0002 [Parcubacteria group bacterium GW2011_GWE1_40_20]